MRLSELFEFTTPHKSVKTTKPKKPMTLDDAHKKHLQDIIDTAEEAKKHDREIQKFNKLSRDQKLKK